MAAKRMFRVLPELPRAISKCSRNEQIRVASNYSKAIDDGAILSLCDANTNNAWKLYA
jgi:hypothetical protein